DGGIRRTHDVPVDNLEGYLLPDTYEFFWGVDPTTVVETMADANAAVFDNDTIQAQMETMGWTRHEVLTLSSMIEAETGLIDERAIISGVFHNRLDRGMLLQCDPTVVYGMGGLQPGERLLRKHLKEEESEYNTYIHEGLPPGPICNPGRASIYAALYPESTDAIFFVADGQGGHVFSKTLREHNRASAQLRKLRRQRDNR
ncbi:MAG: endolytic transglycosylase MltG, partial [candidate division Zixibacteria bacterium]|nr:endolytic transglycosylase MltG [candidate division Zixibacteria bacterium]